jgi:hypothetical protein
MMRVGIEEDKFYDLLRQLKDGSSEERQTAFKGYEEASLSKIQLKAFAQTFETESLPLLAKLTEDGEVWSWAVWDSEEAYKSIPEHLMARKTFVLDLIRGNSNIYRFLDPSLQQDEDVFLTCVQYWDNSGIPLQDLVDYYALPEHVGGNKELILKAVPLYPEITYYTTGTLREDFDFCLRAVDITDRSAKGILMHLLRSQEEDADNFFPESVDQLTDAEAAAQIRILADADNLRKTLPPAGPAKPIFKL